MEARVSQSLGIPSFWPPTAQFRRRIRLVLWWTVTFQLFTQFGFWLRARRLRAVVPTSPLPPLIGVVSADLIELPNAATPLVSVIVPTHGKTEFTLRCLASIAERLPDASIEVIVIDVIIFVGNVPRRVTSFSENIILIFFRDGAQF